jgi:hypothetical protein
MKKVIDLNKNGHELTPIENIDRLYMCAKCNCRVYFYKDVGYRFYINHKVAGIDDLSLTCEEIQIKRLLE